MKIGRATAAALCLSATLTACAETKKQAPPPPAPAAPAAPAASDLPKGTVGQNAVTATAKVKAIDLKTRHVTLQRPDGSLIKFVAGEEVRNLPQVKVGDVVSVTYYESLAYEVHKAGTALPEAASAQGVDRAKPGEKPGALGVQTSTVTATIAAIDKSAGTVTLKGPHGDLTTIKARNPDNLNRVAVGDLVAITYTEAIAISVDKPKKK